jgi:hypothetical protein
VGRDDGRITRKLTIYLAAALPILVWRAHVTPLVAQSLRVELTGANRYLWRGINRTTTWVGQIGASATAPIGSGAVGIGVFESRELGAAGPADLTEVGHGQRGLGERDWWLEYRRPLGSQVMFLGATRYTFHGDQELGGRSADQNTTEIGFGLQARHISPTPALAAYWDVDRVKGLYLEGSGAVPVIPWPFSPPVNVILDAAIGLSVGESPNPENPGEVAYYASDGFTHVVVGLSVDLQASENFTFSTGARLQAGIDDEAKRGAGGQSRGLFLAYWLGTTLRLGRR